MTTQPATDPDPVDRDTLIAEWMQAVATQQAAGDCEQLGCGGKLRPLPANVTPGVVWLEAECDADPRHTVALPNGHRKVAATRRPGPLARVTRVALRVADTAGQGPRLVPDCREAAVGSDW